MASTFLRAQRALRSRFDEFRLAVQRENRTAAEIALDDFEKHFRSWTEAEERALMPALMRAGLAGRDVKRELRLEYVQIRELTRWVLQQLRDGTRLTDLAGYIDNLERRLSAHEREMQHVYYPAAERTLTSDERTELESSAPSD